MDEKKIPDVAFIGICDRAEKLPNRLQNQWYYNILGLRNSVFPLIYPFSLSNFKLVLAVYDFQNFTEAWIKLREEDGREFFRWKFGKLSTPLEQGKKVYMHQEFIIPADFPVWSFMVSDMPDILITGPKRYKIYLVREDQEFILGDISFNLLETHPFTNDQIDAMRSNPTTPKAAWMEIFCRKCGDRLKVYCSLDKNVEIMGNDFMWYQDLPDEFICQCGKFVIELGILRRNMHSLLMRPYSSIKEISSANLYEKEALRNLFTDFLKLLDTNPSEQQVYNFIKENPILLNRFSPERTFFKRPITPKHETDIVILNHQKELILIELESPEKQILTKKGAIHHKTQQAFQQIKDWLYEIKRNRLAVLDCIPLKLDEVSNEKGYVIIGRDKNCNEEHLFKQRSSDLEVELLTYDDLLRDLKVLIRDFGLL